jgi:hypothetical protein
MNLTLISNVQLGKGLNATQGEYEIYTKGNDKNCPTEKPAYEIGSCSRLQKLTLFFAYYAKYSMIMLVKTGDERLNHHALTVWEYLQKT